MERQLVGFIQDVRNVGASNTFLQGACLGQSAGRLYTHEGVLYNPAAYALVVDALQNSGPGSFEMGTGQCEALLALLSDVIETQALDFFSHMPKSMSEPAIKAYDTY
jgi:hypothetical protein